MTSGPVPSEPAKAGAALRECLPRRDWLLLRAAAPSWRHRYLEEFADFLAHTPSGLRRTGGIGVLVARSWLRPGRHVHEVQERLRASLTTQLVIGSTVLAALVVYHFVSVPVPAANRPSAAGSHDLFVVLAGLLFVSSLTPWVWTARRQALGNLAAVVRPLLCSAALAAVGTAVFSLTPGSVRLGLGPASWLAVPAVAVLAAVPGVGVAMHRTMLRLSPRLGALTLGSAWLATLTAAVALYSEPAVRDTAATGDALQSFGWQFLLFWFCVTVAIIATVSTARGLRAALAHRRTTRDRPRPVGD